VPAKFFRTTAKGRVYIPPTSQKGGIAVQKWPEQCLCAIFSPRIVRKVGAKNGEKREKYTYGWKIRSISHKLQAQKRFY